MDGTLRPLDPRHLFVGERLGFTALDGTVTPAPLTSAPLPPAPLTPAPLTPTVWLSAALDSRIARCVWHRIVVDHRQPLGASIVIEARTNEFELTAGELGEPRGWVRLPELDDTVTGAPYEALLANEAGRFLWLRISLDAAPSAAGAPEIHSIDLELPRLTTRRYLPAVFTENAEGAEFTDRFLSIFDTTHRSIESLVDDQARLFAASSAPVTSTSRGRPDFLSYLASWVGITLDNSMPEAARRRLVQSVGRVGALRGTPTGIRELLGALLGVRCSDSPLLLEHFKVRRWLYVGQGRLGADAMLWGESVVNRSSLGATARAGVTRTITTPDPAHDAFAVDAHRFSAYLPAALAATDSHRRTVERLLQSEKPAHTAVDVVYVEPRMRLGIQAVIGLDAVIGRVPEPVVVGAGGALGTDTVVGAGPAGRAGITQIGTGNRIGATARLA